MNCGDIVGMVLNIISIIIGIIGIFIGKKVITSIVNIDNKIIIDQSSKNITVGNTIENKTLADLINDYQF